MTGTQAQPVKFVRYGAFQSPSCGSRQNHGGRVRRGHKREPVITRIPIPTAAETRDARPIELNLIVRMTRARVLQRNSSTGRTSSRTRENGCSGYGWRWLNTGGIENTRVIQRLPVSRFLCARHEASFRVVEVWIRVRVHAVLRVGRVHLDSLWSLISVSAALGPVVVL